MKIKVCGMKYQKNIQELVLIQPDYIGFIFYAGSPRFVGQELNEKFIQSIKDISKVGVFVNEKVKTLLNIVDKYQLDYVQLHGQESSAYCNEISKQVKVIKAFKSDSSLLKIDFKEYSSCELFLFDSPGINHGGNGVKFDYSLLEKINITQPFLLSGGLHHSELNKLPAHPNLIGIDVNSKYEISPGLKNIEELKLLKNKVYELNAIRN